MNLSDLMAQTLLLDLETTRTGKIRHIGAVYNGQVFEKKQNAGSKAVLEALDRFAQPATYILGHNLLGHDFPLLKVSAPWLELLKKPVIDTLYLSPLAFPENPYHPPGQRLQARSDRHQQPRGGCRTGRFGVQGPVGKLSDAC